MFATPRIDAEMKRYEETLLRDDEAMERAFVADLMDIVAPQVFGPPRSFFGRLVDRVFGRVFHTGGFVSCEANVPAASHGIENIIPRAEADRLKHVVEKDGWVLPNAPPLKPIQITVYGASRGQEFR